MLGSRPTGIVPGMIRWSLAFVLVASSALAFPDPNRAARMLLTNEGWVIQPPGLSPEAPVPPTKLMDWPGPVLMDAAVLGAEPARWEVGFLYLLGWAGVPEDSAWGEATLAMAPPSDRARIAYAVGSAIYPNEEARSLALLQEAQTAGVVHAHTTLCTFAHWQLSRRPAQREAGRRALGVARLRPPMDVAECALAEARLAQLEKRWNDAWVLGTAAAKTLPTTPDWDKERRALHGLRVVAAVQSGQFAKLTPTEFDELFVAPLAQFPKLKGIVYGLLVAFTLLVWAWTWWSRARPVGLWLALTWTSLPLVANGLGMVVPLGLPFGATFDRWSGAFVGAAIGLVGLALRRAPLPFGALRFHVTWKHALGLVGLLAGISLVAELHGRVYEALFGVPIESQLIAGMLKVDGFGPRVVTLLAVAIAVPYAEEVAFRGFLYEGFSARWGARVAIIGSAVLFALAHLEPVQPFSKVPIILVMGLVLGVLRYRSGHLGPGVALHAVNNAVATMAAWWWS
jgi:membrane protease YdiL (CAAX protease family)